MAFTGRDIFKSYLNKSRQGSAERADRMRELREELQAESDQTIKAGKETLVRQMRNQQALARAGRGAALVGGGMAVGAAFAGRGLAAAGSAGGGMMTSLAAKVPRPTGSSMLVNAFFFWAILVHAVDIGYGFDNSSSPRFALHVITFILALVIFGQGSFSPTSGFERFKSVPAAFIALIVATVIVPLTNWAVYGFRFITNPEIAAVIAPYILAPFIPVWVYFIIFQDYQQTILTKTARFVWIILFIVTMFIVITNTPAFGQIGKGGISGFQQQQISQAIPNLVKWVMNIPAAIAQGFLAIIKGLGGFTKSLVLYSVGDDYFTGSVDRNVQEPLGVYIEKVKAADPKYYVGDTVLVYAQLRAKTIDVTKAIKIKYECYEEIDFSTKVYGLVNKESSTETFLVEDFDTRDIECRFTPDKLKEGAHTVKLVAEFEDFPTFAYVKAYFMDRQRLRALLRDNIDPLDRFGILDKNPQAIYTNGPIMVGMGITSGVAAVDVTGELTAKLGITIDNRWKGQVVDIKDVYLQIPKELEIKEDGCVNYKVTRAEPKDFSLDTDSSNYETLKLERIKAGKVIIEEVKTPHTILCEINVRENEVKNFLGSSPIAIKYFRAKINYKYKVIEQTSLSINRPPTGYRERTVPTPVPTPTVSGLKTTTTQVSDARLKSIIEIAYFEKRLSATSDPRLTSEAEKDACLRNAEPIIQTSTNNGIDPLFTLAIVLQESKCNEKAERKSDTGGGSYGLMQVNAATAKLTSASSCQAADWKTSAVSNLDCGIRIFIDKHNLFTDGRITKVLCQAATDCNHPYKGSLCSGKPCKVQCNPTTNYCEFEFRGDNAKNPAPPKYYDFSKASLRAYNGWGEAIDKEYADKVWKMYEILLEIAAEIERCPTGTDCPATR